MMTDKETRTLFPPECETLILLTCVCSAAGSSLLKTISSVEPRNLTSHSTGDKSRLIHKTSF